MKAKKITTVLSSAVLLAASGTALADPQNWRHHNQGYHDRVVVHSGRSVVRHVVERPVYVNRPVYVREPVYIDRPVYVEKTVYVDRPVYSERPNYYGHRPVGVYEQPAYYPPPAPAYGNQVVGTLGGAVVGALIGNQVGHGRNRTATTAIGAAVGAAIGSHIR